MKIVYLLDDFPPKSYSSASLITLDLAKAMLKLGHKVFVVTRTGKKIERGEELFEGIKIFRIYSKYPSFLRHWIVVINPQTIFQIKKILKNIQPDICHFHHIHQYLSYYCLKLAKKYSQAVFITAHDAMFFHYGKLMPKKENFIYRVTLKDQIAEAGKTYNPFRNVFIRHYLGNVDKIFTVSDSLKKLFIVNKIKNVETIYNGINVDDWKQNTNEIMRFKEEYNIINKKILFFGGRISGAKGGDQMLLVLSKIRQEIDNVVLIIAGKENLYTQTMRVKIKGLGLNDSVVFTGFLTKDKLKVAYYTSDICVSPSLCFETFGMINLEAMACKKPVVSSYFGGPSETIIDNVTGYLINPYNIALVTEKIVDLLKNPQKAEQFGEAGHQRVKEVFSLQKQIEKTLNYYSKFTKFSD